MNIDRIFQFTVSEIYSRYPTKRDWFRHVRLREFEFLLSVLDNRRFTRALEIGSGDGVQGELLAALCEELICSDVDRKRWDTRQEVRMPKNVSHTILDATDLSRFTDNTFDLVYSSNVLEHVDDVDRCIRETYRVLKPSGIGVHSMPSRYWKLLNTLYHLVKFRSPRIHGAEHTNWDEFIAFGLGVWIEKFENAGFNVDKIYGMPFYYGEGLRWKPLIVLGNRLHLPSSHTLFVKP